MVSRPSSRRGIHGARPHASRVDVILRVDGVERVGKLSGGRWSVWLLVSARRENDVSRSDVALGSPEKKCAIFPGLQASYRHTFVNRRVITLRVADEVADNLVLRHESVGIIAAVAAARQLHGPVGNDKAEAVPAPAPCLPDSASVENDVLYARRSQFVAERKSGLSRADDDDVSVGDHRRRL